MTSLFDGNFQEIERIEYLNSLEYGSKDWDMVSALRELFANMLDTKTEYRYEYFKEKGYGEIEDSSEGLPLKSFVFGGTSKSDDMTSIGQYGEGMKMAFLTSLRLKEQISIQTVGFGIEAESFYSEKYQSDLMCLVLNNNSKEKGTLIRVTCSEEDWNSALNLFLEFKDGYSVVDKHLYLPGGFISILGVKIDELPHLYFSYNLDNKYLTNRDRNAVKLKEFKPIMQGILEGLTDEKAIEIYLKGLEDNIDCEEYRIDLNPKNKFIWKRVANKVFGNNSVYSNSFENDLKARYKGFIIIPTFSNSMKSLFKRLGFKSSNEVIDGIKTKNISLEEDNRIIYSISEKYVKSWNIQDAGRELFSNAIDEVGYNSKCYYKDGYCIISDKGRGLTYKSFVFGESDKIKNSPIGKHGEGLKLALLVLCRENRKVKVYSKDKVYEPKLEYNDKYKQNSFVIYEKNSDIIVDGTKIVFESSEEEVASIINLFLELKSNVEKYIFDNVEIITSEQGNIYVCGVYVDSKPMAFSYNLNDNILTNRDRNIIKNDKLIKYLKPIFTNLKEDIILDKFLVSWKENPKYIEYDIEIVPKYFDIWSEKMKSLFPNSCVADIIDFRSNFIASEAGYNVLQDVPKYLKELFAKVLGSTSEIAKTCDDVGILLQDKIILTVSPHLISRMTKEKAISELISNAIDAGKTLPILRYDNGNIIIEDDGNGLRISNLSLGNSDSYGKTNASGTFGEGLKLSCYYLIKKTIANVIIETVNYTIKVELKVHKESKSDILVFSWKPNERMVGTKIVLKGTSSELEKAKERFLVYNKKFYEVDENIYNPKGYIFVNGVLCNSISELNYTYNLIGLDVKNIIDRDRENMSSDKLTPYLLDFLKTMYNEDVIGKFLDGACFELNIIAKNCKKFFEVESKIEYSKISSPVFISSLTSGAISSFSVNNISYNSELVFHYKNAITKKFGSNKVCLSSDAFSDDNARTEGYIVLKEINDSLKTIMTFLGYETANDILSSTNKEMFQNVVDSEILYNELTTEEQLVWCNLKKVVISEYSKSVWSKFHICTKFKDLELGEVDGLYLKSHRVIFIKRSMLKKNNMAKLLGVAIHEILHMQTNLGDVTRKFESALTNKIGNLCNTIYSDSFEWTKVIKMDSEEEMKKSVKEIMKSSPKEVEIIKPKIISTPTIETVNYGSNKIRKSEKPKKKKGFLSWLFEE